MRKAFLFLLVLALCTGCRSFKTAPEPPPDEVQGAWQCTSSVYAEVPTPAAGPDGRVPVDVRFTIDAEGVVSGAVGDAAITGCVFQFNRGALGRKLNIKTDYIIQGGTLEGAIYPGDPVTSRTITIPFNLKDGELVGTVMDISSGLNVKPVTRQLRMEQVEAPDAAE